MSVIYLKFTVPSLTFPSVLMKCYCDYIVWMYQRTDKRYVPTTNTNIIVSTFWFLIGNVHFLNNYEYHKSD